MATLTYVYAESTAVLGPLSTFAEPHTYDLCSFHAERLTAPQGWDLVRLASHFDEPSVDDDLSAVADAVREPVGGAGAQSVSPAGAKDRFDERDGNGTDGVAGVRGSRLRVLRDGHS